MVFHHIVFIGTNYIFTLKLSDIMCGVVPCRVKEGSTLFGNHGGSITSNKADISQEAKCRCQHDETSAQSNLF